MARTIFVPVLMLFSSVSGYFKYRYTGWLCRGMISATSFTLVGVVNKFVTVLLNVVVWDKHSTTGGLAAVCVCLLAGSFYQQAPRRDEAHKDLSSTASTSGDATLIGSNSNNSSNNSSNSSSSSLSLSHPSHIPTQAQERAQRRPSSSSFSSDADGANANSKTSGMHAFEIENDDAWDINADSADAIETDSLLAPARRK
jgi:hypothetical protein